MQIHYDLHRTWCITDMTIDGIISPKLAILLKIKLLPLNFVFVKEGIKSLPNLPDFISTDCASNRISPFGDDLPTSMIDRIMTTTWLGLLATIRVGEQSRRLLKIY